MQKCPIQKYAKDSQANADRLLALGVPINPIVSTERIGGRWGGPTETRFDKVELTDGGGIGGLLMFSCCWCFRVVDVVDGIVAADAVGAVLVVVALLLLLLLWFDAVLVDTSSLLMLSLLTLLLWLLLLLSLMLMLTLMLLLLLVVMLTLILLLLLTLSLRRLRCGCAI